MKLHDTGEMQLGDTSKGFSGDARKVGLQSDHDPSATRYMPGVRRGGC